MKRCAVLLAGGSGTRLWPMSRKHLPKQLIKIYSHTTLLELTIQRFLNSGEWDIVVVTTQAYASIIEILIKPYAARLIVEPSPRNTAPALALACATLREWYSEDVLLVVTPTDHIVADQEQFNQTISAAAHYAETHDVLSIVGVPQRTIATQYGFIEVGRPLSPGEKIHEIVQFYEKPPFDRAKEYYSQANMLWNMGVVCARLSALWRAFNEVASDIVSHLTSYESLLPVQFDRAVLEKYTKNLAVVVSDEMGWSDIGSLEMFIPAISQGTQYAEIAGAQNNLVSAQKRVVIAGISDMCVFELDDCIVLMPRSMAHAPESVAQKVVEFGWRDLL